MTEFLLIGKKGFLGSFIFNMFTNQKINFNCLDDRLENPIIYDKINDIKPKYIICAAGIVGKPNRDWCKDNPNETINTNIICYLNLCNFCKNKNIKLIFFGSIGIYNSINNQIFNEDDKPNNINHIYLFTKYTFEQLVKDFKNVLILRLGHCLSLQKNKKNLLTKILNFKYIHDKKMSISILDQVFIHLPYLSRNKNGIINLVSPGFISLYNIFNIYKKKLNYDKEISLIDYDYNKHREISYVTSKYLDVELEDVSDFLNKYIYKYNE